MKTSDPKDLVIMGFFLVPSTVPCAFYSTSLCCAFQLVTTLWTLQAIRGKRHRSTSNITYKPVFQWSNR